MCEVPRFSLKPGSAQVFEYKLFAELLGLVVPFFWFLFEAFGWLKGVGPLQSPGVESRLERGVVEDAAGQNDGGALLG